jgi:hypothetical protein
LRTSTWSALGLDGGGGGGYGTSGEYAHQSNGDTANAAAGGAAYGDETISTLYLGSGGGSSGSVSAGARGGNGGGSIQIIADQIIVNGRSQPMVKMEALCANTNVKAPTGAAEAAAVAEVLN